MSTVSNILDPEGNVVKDLHNENPAFLKYKFSFNDVDSGKICLPLIFQIVHLDSIAYSSIPSSILSFIHSFTHSFIHSFIHSFFSFVYSFVYSLFHLFIYWFLYSYFHPLAPSLLHSFIYFFILSFIHLFLRHLFILLTFHSVIDSLIYSYIHYSNYALHHHSFDRSSYICSSLLHWLICLFIYSFSCIFIN